MLCQRESASVCIVAAGFSPASERSEPQPRRAPANRRELAKAETQAFQSWGSSERAWKFNPESAPTGYTIAEMKQHYEQQCDKSFLSTAAPTTPHRHRRLPSAGRTKSKAMKRP